MAVEFSLNFSLHLVLILWFADMDMAMAINIPYQVAPNKSNLYTIYYCCSSSNILQQQASLHSYHSAVDKFSMQLIFSIGTHTDRNAFILKTIHDDGTMCSYCMLSRVYHLLCRGCDTSAHSTWNIWFWFALLCFELIGWLWVSLWVSFFLLSKVFHFIRFFFFFEVFFICFI